MSKHTPGKWSVKQSGNATPVIMHPHGDDPTDPDDLSGQICSMPAEITRSYNSLANAQRIVTCVNAHDELVEALEGLAREAEMAVRCEDKELAHEIKKSRAALERAKA